MKLLVVDDQHSVHMYLQKALDFAALGFDDVLLFTALLPGKGDIPV